MKILAIECSAGPASAAVLEDGRIISSSYANVKLTHSQTLMPMIENTLSQALLSFSDIDGLAVSRGPGSFTGIRIGIAAAKGLAAPRSLPCAGVSTLLSIAYNYSDTDCILCAVMDARCGQVYNALFNIENGNINRICEDRAIMCRELSEELKKMSPELKKHVIIAGDGTEVFYPFAEKLRGVIKSGSKNRFQNAASVGLAAQKAFADGKALPPENLLPVYLRLPQAERELKKKKEKRGLV